MERQVLGILNRLIHDPQLITYAPKDNSRVLAEQRQTLDNFLRSPPVDEEQARKLALDCAGAALDSIGPEEYETLRLRRLFQGWAPMAELEQELLHQSVRRIAVSNGTVTVLLKNNQTLEGGHYT